MVNYVFGMPGFGEKEHIYEKIKENIEKETRTYILVPEQYSLFAEKDMLKKLGFDAQKYVQVLTFSRLCNMVLSALGPLRMKYIDSAGKNMIAARTLQSLEKELVFFKKNVYQQGFSGMLVSAFAEFKRYGITSEGLEIAAEKCKTEDLKKKLAELSLLYKKYNELLNEKNSDAEDNLALIIPKISKCDFLSGELYVNYFKSFTPIEYAAIFELMKKMNVTFSFVSDNLLKTKGAFRSAGLTYKKLNEFAEKNGIEIGKSILLKEDKKHKDNGEMAFLKENYLSYSPKTYDKTSKNIRLIRPRTYYDEAQAAAKNIIRLCRTKEYSFDDFVIITPDGDTYKDIIPVVFEKYNINVFLDAKKPISSHIFLRFINNCLEILARGFSYERIMNAIRTGFFSLDNKEADIFENYLLASGVAGKHYSSIADFTYNPDESRFDMEVINSVKRRSVNLIIELGKSIRGRKTIRQICTTLCDWMEKSGIKALYEKRINTFLENIDIDSAKEYEAVWNALMAIFSQMEEMFGEENITYERFYQLFRAAVDNVKTGSVPSLINQVQVIDADKFVSTDAKITMVLGVTEGSFPKSFSEDGIISDEERRELTAGGMVLAPTAYDKQYDEQLSVFSVLTSPSEELWLFSPVTNGEGDTVESGEVFSSIKKMFPSVKEEFTESLNNEFFLEGKNAAFDMLYNEICDKKGNIEELEPFWGCVYDYFKVQEDFSDRLKQLENFSKIEEDEVKLSRSMAGMLYGKPMMLSVSRLEKYNACAFSYFLTYGLFIDERKKASFESNDMGTALHDVLCKYFENKKKENADYSLITYEEVKRDTAELIDKNSDLSTSMLYETSSYYRFVLLRIKNIAATTAWKIVRFYANSSFRPYGFEIKIGADGIFPPYTITIKDTEAKIRGFIDRMDISEIDGKKYFNIVDYKSSEKKIDLELARLGVRFQPLLYAGIVKENIENSEPAAMLYMQMNDPVTEFNSKPEDDAHNRAVMKEVKVEGLVLNQENVAKSLDYSFGEKDAVHYVPNSKNSIVDNEQMEELLCQAMNTAKETAEKIAEGNIEVNPLVVKNFDACEYCKFKSCCGIVNE